MKSTCRRLCTLHNPSDRQMFFALIVDLFLATPKLEVQILLVVIHAFVWYGTVSVHMRLRGPPSLRTHDIRADIYRYEIINFLAYKVLSPWFLRQKWVTGFIELSQAQCQYRRY